MRAFECLVSIDHYGLVGDRHGAFGDEIVIRGWAIAGAPLRSAHLRLGNWRTPIRGINLPSDDVGSEHAAAFGAHAGACRFEHREIVAERDFRAAPAVLELDFGEMSFRCATGLPFEAPAAAPIPEDPETARRIRDLVMSYESCGDNCEFGLFQREVGDERLALLRYASVRDANMLAAAIDEAFAGFDRADEVLPTPQQFEWMVHVPLYGLVFHTGRPVSSVGAERIATLETGKLRFLADKFLDDLADSDKVFLYCTKVGDRGGDRGERGMLALHAAMRRVGPATLLWLSDDGPADGPDWGFREVADGLWRGWHARMAPYSDAYANHRDTWLGLLADFRDTRGRGRDGEAGPD